MYCVGGCRKGTGVLRVIDNCVFTKTQNLFFQISKFLRARRFTAPVTTPHTKHLTPPPRPPLLHHCNIDMKIINYCDNETN
jgi:hypothetical protein